MATTDEIVRLGERLRAALPVAIGETFGGATDLPELVPGPPAQLVADLGPGVHVHLEMEVRLGRVEPANMSVIMLAADGEKLFGLEEIPDSELSKPDNQLRLLAEFSEGAEALTGALAGALTTETLMPSVRVSGASLEEANSSPAAVLAQLGATEPVAYAGILLRPGGLLMPVVVVVNGGLVAALAAGGASGVTGTPTAAVRAAGLAARQAARRQTPDQVTPPPTAAPLPPARPAIAVNPVSFGQLEPAASAPRTDRGVDLILDVALNVRVELGSTQMTVEEVLGLSPGSVVELDRLAGEPVDIVINDRLIARGEVVVIEENFGVRVTEIIAPRQRATALA